MKTRTLFQKFKQRVWTKLVRSSRLMPFYPMMYLCYWHYRLHPAKSDRNLHSYFSAVPNPGAGIGHQLANWIAGYWFAGQFSLKFAHTSFSNEKWEKFLGLGEDEVSVRELLKKGYKRVKLPLFDETNASEILQITNIIKSYGDKPVVFIAEQDQPYTNQYEVMADLQSKFFNSISRKNDKLLYSQHNFNIAVHIRRGDIVIGQQNQHTKLTMRWLDNTYYDKVLSSVLSIDSSKPVFVYIFSQGDRQDFPEFERFENVQFCLDMDPQESFLHMVYADLLISSKSSFSYKPALLSQGIKLCPEDFWHGYPKSEEWILVDKDGVFDKDRLSRLMHDLTIR